MKSIRKTHHTYQRLILQEMKYKKIVVGVALTFLLGVAHLVNADNIITNPGFENNLQEWQTGFWGGAEAVPVISTEVFNEGSKALQFQVTTASPDEASKAYFRKNGLRIVQGNTYTLSLAVLSNSGVEESIDISFYSHLDLGGATWGRTFENKGITFQGDGTWKTLTFEFLATNFQGEPDFNNMALMFGMGKNVTTIYVDNISLVSKTPVSTKSTYHVSKDGNDDNEGTLESPFLTIDKAASLVYPGDSVLIHEGTYEETLRPVRSGTEAKPIVFESYEDDKVIITAMQALSGWEKDSGVIFKTSVDWNLGQLNFVMNGDVACDLARWPNNTDGDMFTLNSLRNTGGSGQDEVNAYLTHNDIPDYNWENGGSIFFYGDRPGSGWTAWKAWISGSSQGRVDFNLNKNPDWIRTFHEPAGKGDFYLEGVKEALDYQNEWYFDEQNSVLYIQLPNGSKPQDGKVQMRKREFVADLNSRDYIEINNLALFGGGVRINGDGNKLKGISSFYGAMTRGVVSGFKSNVQSINIKGSHNTIEKSEVAFGAGSGISNEGGNYTTVIDCNVHDFNFLGCYDAPMLVRGGTNALIKNNNISRGGRDAIQITSKHSEVAYNDISQSNLIADDCALLYTIGAGLHMKIHHNWFHDTEGRGSLKKSAGIYLDNDAGNVDVYNNVVWNTEWSSIQINWNGTNINVYNNTLWDGSEAMGAWHKEGTAFSNVNVWNNLTNKNSLEPQSDKQNNVIMNESANPFTDKDNFDFTLKAGEQAIDFGKQIAGYTDGFVGNAPDAGAYETGGTMWKAGITWSADEGPTGNGCYGLPGNCSDTEDPDTDGDGVADSIDQCPNTPQGTAVNEVGCVLDTDGDGVADNIDQCPNTAQGINVDATGCELDSDGDGVLDSVDECPNTPQGVTVDAVGCEITTSLNDIDKNFSVYPNPVDGEQLHISKLLTDGQQALYFIQSADGKNILSGKVDGKKDIDVSQLKGGVYILKLQLGIKSYIKKLLVL